MGTCLIGERMHARFAFMAPSPSYVSGVDPVTTASFSVLAAWRDTSVRSPSWSSHATSPCPAPCRCDAFSGPCWRHLGLHDTRLFWSPTSRAGGVRRWGVAGGYSNPSCLLVKRLLQKLDEETLKTEHTHICGISAVGEKTKGRKE